MISRHSMSATSSKSSNFLLFVLVSLCIMGAAAGVATLALAVTTSNKDAPNSNAGERDTEMGQAEPPKENKSAVTHGDQVTVVKSRLPTNMRLRRQSNRLDGTRVTRAASATEEDVPAHENPVENPNRHRRDMISCITEKSNDTIPAAHIRGHGLKPFQRSTYESSGLVYGYQQRWMCCEYSITTSHNAHAFVDGGMIFNQTDKSLRVPTCGYYHVFSQIYYKIDGSAETSVFHLLKFKRNCPSWPESNPVTVMGRSSVAHDDTTSYTTTYTSDVVHLCAGGKIWVEIPDVVPCCPMGDDQGTFIGAYLVAETTCHWPPDIQMKNLNV